MNKITKEVSIIILSKNEEENIGICLDNIFKQNYDKEFEVILIDSSTDKTREMATKTAEKHNSKYRLRILDTPAEKFNHGKVRNIGIRESKGKYIIFLSADAYPENDNWLKNLINNFNNSNIAGVFGKQIPKPDATPLEQFFLSEMYPNKRLIKTNEENKNVFDVLFSFVNCAIKRDALNEYPLSEEGGIADDFIWALSVLPEYDLVYDHNSGVYHTHNYTLKAVFQRFFDLGSSFKSVYSDNKDYSLVYLIKKGGCSFIMEMKFLYNMGYVKYIPYALIYDTMRFLGMAAGKNHEYLPLSLKRRFAGFKSYWNE